jgi:transcriptional regulator with XRE-family HTH domain
LSSVASPNPEIPTRLRVLIALHNLKSQEVAQRAGIAPETLSRVLAGTQRPSPDLVRRVEAAIIGEAEVAS